MHAEKLTNRKPAYPIFFEPNYPCDTQSARPFAIRETKQLLEKEKIIMSSKNSNKLNIPEAKAAMNKFKMEAASEDDVPSTY